MKASERWLLDKAGSYEPGLASWHAMMVELERRYTHEVARIDAAEARFEACSPSGRHGAESWLKPVIDWADWPNRWENLADVAEGIDRRSQAEPIRPVAVRCPECRSFVEPARLDRRQRAEGEVTDTERLDWIDRHMDCDLAGDGLHVSAIDLDERGTLRDAIDAAMSRAQRAKAAGGEAGE